MSKHTTVTATLGEIIDRIDSDRHADAPWYDVMSIEIPGLADAMANDELDTASEIEAAYIREHESDLYEIRWPDHIIVLRYDGDASYMLIEHEGKFAGSKFTVNLMAGSEIVETIAGLSAAEACATIEPHINTRPAQIDDQPVAWPVATVVRDTDEREFSISEVLAGIRQGDLKELLVCDFSEFERYNDELFAVIDDSAPDEKRMIHYSEIRYATLEELNAALGSDGYHDDIYAARDAVARMINAKQPLTLYDYRLGDAIRPASDDEAGESINAGDEGVITVDGQRCYVA